MHAEGSNQRQWQWQLYMLYIAGGLYRCMHLDGKGLLADTLGRMQAAAAGRTHQRQRTQEGRGKVGR